MSVRWPPPTVGDIVWCLFPELPALSPGPKPRSALVLGVETREDGIAVKVAYGTSKKVASLRAGEFALSPAGVEFHRLASSVTLEADRRKPGCEPLARAVRGRPDRARRINRAMAEGCTLKGPSRLFRVCQRTCAS